MASVILPHLDVVIEMIEKNIFRPLPVLKKAGPPGEEVGGDIVRLLLFRMMSWLIQLGHICYLFMSSFCNSLLMKLLM